MERLCERPGCSDPASVAYGMRPEDLVFWLDVLRDSGSQEHGVLCRRHADSMIVPRSWTLDDLRDPDLHLFRPPDDDTRGTPRPRSRRRNRVAEHEQLALGVEGADQQHDPPAVAHDGSSDHESADDESQVTPWMPIFDTDDDLDGLLAARSPLLSRAFQGERQS
ncbi:MAG: hypothetical protein AAFP84_07630 [Actinomycetota bacterium]